MSEFLKFLLWLVVFFIAMMSLLTILIIIALIVKGVRSENMDSDYVSDAGNGRNVLDPKCDSNRCEGGDSDPSDQGGSLRNS